MGQKFWTSCILANNIMQFKLYFYKKKLQKVNKIILMCCAW